MARFNEGDRVRCYRDSNYEQCKKTGIWNYPSECGQSKLVGKVGTVCKEPYSDSCYDRQGDVCVHFDHHDDHTFCLVEVRDLEKI